MYRKLGSDRPPLTLSNHNDFFRLILLFSNYFFLVSRYFQFSYIALYNTFNISPLKKPINTFIQIINLVTKLFTSHTWSRQR